VTDRLDLEIARVRFAICAPPGVHLIEDDPRYQPFLDCGRDTSESTEVAVALELGGEPDTRGLDVLFETGESWRAYRDGEDVLLQHAIGPERERPLWLARFQVESQRVVVHCGSALIERDSESTTLRNPLHYPLDQLLMMFLLPRHDGLLLHATGVRSERGCAVFPGRSGAGKSTLARLLASRGGLERLSDDRIVVRWIDSSALAFGTPWAGTEQLAANASAELRALVFLHQAEENRLQAIGKAEALRQLLPTASILWFDQQRADASLVLCKRLVERVPAYEIRFRNEPAVYDALAELF
jgi:hypothetical protein